MIDNIKLMTLSQNVIATLQSRPEFTQCKPPNNNYHSYSHQNFGTKLRLDFRKSVENGRVVGYHHVEITASPHYHYNGYKHNGNDFTPSQAITAIEDILSYLQIAPKEYEELKVCNIEFGLNLITGIEINALMGGLLFYKKTQFVTPDPKMPCFKKSGATAYKQVKAYAKGLQFSARPEYGINLNTFRFEVKSKQAKNIRKYGISNITALLQLQTYDKLGQTLLDEWGHILITNKNHDLKDLNYKDAQLIGDAKKLDFWSNLMRDEARNKFGKYRQKYYSILERKNNIHHLIKCQIIDKLLELKNGANSTQRTPINREKHSFKENPSTLINLEFAPLCKNHAQNSREKKDKTCVLFHAQNNTQNALNSRGKNKEKTALNSREKNKEKTYCKTTGIDISHQRKGSEYITARGLDLMKINDVANYNTVVNKYWTKECEKGNVHYHIAHNIRNTYNNSETSRKRRKKRGIGVLFCEDDMR